MDLSEVFTLASCCLLPNLRIGYLRIHGIRCIIK